MSALAEADTYPQTIEPTINYLVNDGTEVFTGTTSEGGTLDVKSGGKIDPHKVVMHNGRPHVDEFKLDVDGFRFVRHDTKMQNFLDADEIKRVYYPEVIELIKAESGAKRVVVFDHTLRTADDGLREQHKIREVVQRAHNDYTEWSGPQRVRDILPDEAEELLKRRFAIIQAWRPIRYPIENHPLAIADARTVSFDDFILSERRYPNRIGQTYAVAYNPKHKWFWFPRQARDEALVFKVYDSAKDGRARWTAHTSFDDPSAPRNARPRESIEIRTLAFF
ncbi:methyltransferase [Pseudolabrys taiwanensis]|uniref:Methyltransferase n=1 Tax=Pseudolabrys taiwanensis TaxID=331696 RepID=A0A345ZU29_9HYPH|nr:CmcJ/NvfI family oxidoreductase [Pseudolabrys taiwanensis]AXK80426.1 methyltransferase [Pseudolabrys taiwanensis]